MSTPYNTASDEDLTAVISALDEAIKDYEDRKDSNSTDDTED